MFSDFTQFCREQFKEPSGSIPLHRPYFIGNEKKYVADAIDSTFVSSVGEYVNLFEKNLKDYCGANYAIACVNGTAALHISLLLAGLKSDELVITQPLSFIATCNAISYIGSQPLFIDINKETLGLCPEKLLNFLKDKTEIRKDGFCYHKPSGKRIAACVPMHTFGHPVQIDSIAEICSNYNIPLIEDAAESIGSFYKGKHTGTFGLLGTLSFNGNKTITCGGGGAILTNNKEIAQKAKHLTTQAKVPHAWDFVHDEIGYNYRMPNLNAALACAQLENLNLFLEKKRALAASYKRFFEKNNIAFIHEPKDSKSNYWLNAILLNDRTQRDEFLAFTNSNGVMTRPSWTLMNKLVMFKDCITENIDNAIYIEERLVNIPSSYIPY